MRLLIHQGTDDLAPHNLFVYCVGLDVLAVEVQTASGASNRVRASDKRREPGDEMISVAAKWPIAAPRRVAVQSEHRREVHRRSAAAGT